MYIIVQNCCTMYPWCTKEMYKEKEWKGNVLFNDALNTFLFYLRLYGVRHMVKDNSDSKKGNPLPPLRYRRIK